MVKKKSRSKRPVVLDSKKYSLKGKKIGWLEKAIGLGIIAVIIYFVVKIFFWATTARY